MISNCRACGGTVDLVLRLGNQYVSDFVKPGEKGVQVPLELVKCRGCELVQLSETVDQSKLYSHFWYQSGISSTMRSSLEDIAKAALSVLDKAGSSIVLDIGCNDGTLLRCFPDSFIKIGFEPAANVALKAQNAGVIVPRYFNAKDYHFPRADIVTTIAMFYDLEDPNRFVSDIRQVLAQNGVWINQMNYLGTMIEKNNYDNICHEHLEYYSLTSLMPLLHRHGLEAFHVETNDVNGGSFRVFISHQGTHQPDETIQKMLRDEKPLKSLNTYSLFQQRIETLRGQLRTFLEDAYSRGEKVYVYGASTRGNTILQYSQLAPPLIEKATDANPEKHGLVTVGSNIPIIPKQQARKEHPDYFLLLPTHFIDEIMEEEKEFRKAGGKFILPLPEFKVI